jgi:hypothetical protein
MNPLLGQDEAKLLPINVHGRRIPLVETSLNLDDPVSKAKVERKFGV